jgi:small neutral amino acid transporter SnatA (MarC family)
MANKLFHYFVTLLVHCQLIGVVPLFVAVAGHESAATRRRIARQAILIIGATRSRRSVSAKNRFPPTADP